MSDREQRGSLAGMPKESNEGGGLRSEAFAKGGTGAQTPSDTGTTSRRYENLTETPDEEDEGLDRRDKTIADSFPASDPPSTP